MRRGFTLVEVMVVVLISTVLFGAILTVLVTSDKSWRLGQNKLRAQQEARKAMDNIASYLRESNPQWSVNATLYPVNITDSGRRIDFYQPIFDLSGNITSLKKITFKINPSNSRQLLKKEGTQEAVVVANEIESINFGGGCSGCTAFNCTSVANDCPQVRVNITTKKRQSSELEHQLFNLSSWFTLRNSNVTPSNDTLIEQPSEGEF